jgi:hypothetical protein
MPAKHHSRALRTVLVAPNVFRDHLQVPGGDGHGHGPPVAPRLPRRLLGDVRGLAALGHGRRHVLEGEVLRQNQHALRGPPLVPALPLRHRAATAVFTRRQRETEREGVPMSRTEDEDTGTYRPCPTHARLGWNRVDQISFS